MIKLLTTGLAAFLLLVTVFTHAQDNRCVMPSDTTWQNLTQQCSDVSAGMACTPDRESFALTEIDLLQAPAYLTLLESGETVLRGVLMGAAVLDDVSVAEAPDISLEARNSAGYNINLRSGPGTDYERQGIFIFDETADAIGRTSAGDWVRLQTDDGIAWVARRFVALEGDIEMLPVVTGNEQPVQSSLSVRRDTDCPDMPARLALSYTGDLTMRLTINTVQMELSAGTYAVEPVTDVNLRVSVLAGETVLQQDNERITLAAGETVLLTDNAAITGTGLSPRLPEKVSRALPDEIIGCFVTASDDEVAAYTAPDSDTDTVFSVAATAYPVTGQVDEGNWWQIRLEEQIGWLADENVQTAGNCESVEIVQSGDTSSEAANPPAMPDLSPADVMYAYLQARVNSNTSRMQALSCAAWDDQARIQAQSFRAMRSELQNVGCSTTSQETSTATVFCSGNIVTYYNNQTRTWELGQYALVREGSRWRMCGES